MLSMHLGPEGLTDVGKSKMGFAFFMTELSVEGSEFSSSALAGAKVVSAPGSSDDVQTHFDVQMRRSTGLQTPRSDPLSITDKSVSLQTRYTSNLPYMPVAPKKRASTFLTLSIPPKCFIVIKQIKMFLNLYSF